MVLTTRFLHTCYRRGVAGLVLVTFTAGTLHPLSVLAKAPSEPGFQLAQATPQGMTKRPLHRTHRAPRSGWPGSTTTSRNWPPKPAATTAS